MKLVMLLIKKICFFFFKNREHPSNLNTPVLTIAACWCDRAAVTITAIDSLPFHYCADYVSVILLSVCFIKTCTNPPLLTLWTRFLSYHFIVVLYSH